MDPSVPGFQMPSALSMSPGALFANLLFSLIGTAAFIYGRKSENIRAVVIGIALGVYPWFVTNVWLLYGIGFAFVAALFFWRD